MPDERLSRPDGDEPPHADTGSDSAPSGDEAALLALARARASAEVRGYRPGMRPRSSVFTQAAVREHSGPQRSGVDAREPQAVANTMAKLIAEHGWTRPVTIGGVVGRWADIVGDQIAEHCRPESFTDGVVILRADSTAWATQVRLLLPSLLARLADDLGEGVVTEVKVLGPRGPSWKKGIRSVPGRGPRDTYG